MSEKENKRTKIRTDGPNTHPAYPRPCEPGDQTEQGGMAKMWPYKPETERVKNKMKKKKLASVLLFIFFFFAAVSPP